jgi:hypothetical protein
MSNQLSIQASQAALSSTAPSRTDEVPAQAQAAPTAKPVPLFVNPSFQFDPTVGIVVIDFHNDTGAVTNSIPSQRQLEAYRTHREALPGEQAPPAPKPAPTRNAKTAPG